MGIFDIKPNVEKLKASKNVKGLIKALKYEDQYVRGGAAEALGNIGDKRAVGLLTNALKDKDICVRMRTTEALDQLGWVPKDDSEKIRYLIAKKTVG